MNCNCKADFEAKLLAHYQAALPDHTKHEVTLEGYGYILGDGLGYKPYMPVRVESQRPVKGGGSRKAVARSSMFFNYCPFCGKRIDPAKAPAAAATAKAAA